MFGRRKRQILVLQVIKEKNLRAVLDSKQHWNADLSQNAFTLPSSSKWALTGGDFSRIRASVLHTMQWKHVQIAFSSWKTVSATQLLRFSPFSSVHRVIISLVVFFLSPVSSLGPLKVAADRCGLTRGAFTHVPRRANSRNILPGASQRVFFFLLTRASHHHGRRGGAVELNVACLCPSRLEDAHKSEAGGLLRGGLQLAREEEARAGRALAVPRHADLSGGRWAAAQTFRHQRLVIQSGSCSSCKQGDVPPVLGTGVFLSWNVPQARYFYSASATVRPEQVNHKLYNATNSLVFHLKQQRGRNLIISCH